jgi:lysine-specific demethylase/histidyl-hydroxylase NO66
MTATQLRPTGVTEIESDSQPATKEGLLRLVDDVDRLLAVWEQEPLVITGLGSFSDIFSTAEAERMLRSGLPLPALRLFDHGEKPPSARFARPLDFNPRSRQQFADVGKVSQAVSRGATLVLEELQTFSPSMAEFVGILARQTGYRIDSTAFLTPAHSRGADPHADPVSFFLRQVEGSKRWLISRGRERWPHQRWQAGSEEGAEQVLDVVLHEGDCLYLPRGFIHVGETADDPSVHVSISLNTETWATALQAALAAAAPETEALREMLPPLFDPVDREELFRERQALLLDVLGRLRYDDLSTGRNDSSAPPPELLSLALNGTSRHLEQS